MYEFRVAAENEVGAGPPTETPTVSLQTHARKLLADRRIEIADITNLTSWFLQILFPILVDESISLLC